MRRLPLLLLSISFACGASTASKTVGVPEKVAPGPSSSEAEATITAADMKRHVGILASDEYGGRETLEPGYEKAAAYIAQEFQSYGLNPMPGQDDFIVPYTLDQHGYDMDATKLSLTTKAGSVDVVLGEQGEPFPFSDEGSFEGEIVFAGYGITAPELDYDDYADLNVKDKWVLVYRHAPGYLDEKSPFFGGERKQKKPTDPKVGKEGKEGKAQQIRGEFPVLKAKKRKKAPKRKRGPIAKKGQKGSDAKPPPDPRTYSSFLTKAINAQDRGAKGMLLVSGPATAKMPDDFRLRARLSVPLTEKEKLELEKKLAERKKAHEARLAAQAKAEAAKKTAEKKPKKATKSKKSKPTLAQTKKPVVPEEKKILAFHVSQALGTSLIAHTGKTLADLQKELDGGTAASKFKLGASASATVKRMKDPAKVAVKNVIAYREGSDPKLKNEFIVIGGHFDHLGGFDAEGEADTVFNGADDNASGTSGVLELAQAFAHAGQAPKRSVLFMAFSGEEKGLLGSRALVKQGPVESAKVVFMLNLDMIGRNDKEPVEFVGGDHATRIREIAESANEKLQLPLKFGDYAANSDHHSFFKKEVPVAFFFTGLHEDYHGLGDHAEKLDYGRMEKIVKLGYELVGRVANDETRPVFIHKLSWLGASLLLESTPEGVHARLNEVEADSRAAAANLQVGDVVTKIGDTLIADGMSVAGPEGTSLSAGRVLSELDPGSKFDLTIRRGSEQMTIPLERAKRGYLGIWPGSLSDEDRQKFALDKSEGVLIGKAVPDAPAFKSGLRDGDIITKLAGHPVNNSSLMKRLSRIGAGEKITVQLIRDGKRIEMPLTLGEPPQRPRR